MYFKEVYLKIIGNKELLINQEEIIHKNDLKIKKQNEAIYKLEEKKSILKDEIFYNEKKIIEEKSIIDLYIKKIDMYKENIRDNAKKTLLFKEENEKILKEIEKYKLIKIKNESLLSDKEKLEEQISLIEESLNEKNTTLSALKEVVDELEFKIVNSKIVEEVDSVNNIWKAPKLYNNFQVYESNKELNQYIHNFVEKYFSNCQHFIIPSVEEEIINYISTGKEFQTIVHPFYYDVLDTINFYNEIILKFIKLLENKGFEVSSREKLLIKYIKFEVIRQIFQGISGEINISKIKHSNARDTFYSFFNYYQEKELKKYSTIAFVSFFFFKNKISIDNYMDLDEFYAIQEKYYEDYKLSELDKAISINKKDELKIEKINEIIGSLDLMSGFEFEEYLSKLFLKMGFKTRNTKKTGDQGADLVIENEGIIYAVQAKRYSTNIGNKAVQEAISGKEYYSTDYAMVVSTNYYTKQAIDLATKSNVILWDRDKLISIINEVYIEK